jgi:hypothetical protein
MGKSAVDAKIIQEGQRREVLSDALMQLRELNPQIDVGTDERSLLRRVSRD